MSLATYSSPYLCDSLHVLPSTVCWSRKSATKLLRFARRVWSDQVLPTNRLMEGPPHPAPWFKIGPDPIAHFRSGASRSVEARSTMSMISGCWCALSVSRKLEPAMLIARYEHLTPSHGRILIQNYEQSPKHKYRQTISYCFAAVACNGGCRRHQYDVLPMASCLCDVASVVRELQGIQKKGTFRGSALVHNTQCFLRNWME